MLFKKTKYFSKTLSTSIHFHLCCKELKTLTTNFICFFGNRESLSLFLYLYLFAQDTIANYGKNKNLPEPEKIIGRDIYMEIEGVKSLGTVTDYIRTINLFQVRVP
jgi:hypothetical protein